MATYILAVNLEIKAMKGSQNAESFNSLPFEQRASMEPFLSAELDENKFMTPRDENSAERKTMTFLENNAWWIVMAAIWIPASALYLFTCMWDVVVADKKLGSISYVEIPIANDSENRYFLADFPEGWQKWLLILLTVPLWPVYLVSWSRMKRFKAQQNDYEEGGIY